MAQWFGAAFSPGCDPGDLGLSPTIGLPAWSLLLPMPVSLPLSLCVSLIGFHYTDALHFVEYFVLGLLL